MSWGSAAYVSFITIIGQTNILMSLLFNRVLFATIALSILVVMTIFARRRNLAPAIRSYLWALCVPALFIPFERGVIILMQGQILELNLIFLSYVWLLGFSVCMIKTYRERRKTIRLLKTGEIEGCAVYYYKFRSYIYTPPNFDEIYTENEREMLMAHEQQHIKQRDQFLFLFLQSIQCVFWFNPLIHKAVQCIRHDRELLCDERVTSYYSKIDYAELLLNEAQKATPACHLAGIASNSDGIFERIVACTRPFSYNKRIAILITFVAIALFLFGAIGFTRPIVYHPMETMIVCAEDFSHTHIDRFDKFVTQYQGNIIISEELYFYAIADGFETVDSLSLVIIQVRRPSIFNTSTVSRGFMFTISDLENGEISIPYHYAGYNLRSLWGVLYRIL